MGIVNLSVVGMGIISAGITTMGLWEYSPKSHNHEHHIPTERTSNIKKDPVARPFYTKEDAGKSTSKYRYISENRCPVKCT